MTTVLTLGLADVYISEPFTGNARPFRAHRTLGFYPSQTGRLMLVGDVHGCDVELAELLHELQDDLGIDKLVFVGDLGNKGPKSTQVQLARCMLFA